MNPSPDEHFRFVASAQLVDQLRAMEAVYASVGRGQEFRTALPEAHGHMTSAPLPWGEPEFDLHHLGITVGVGIRRPLVVRYGVDPARRIVYLQHVQLRSDPPAAS
jgi:hypothetical protein